MAIMKEEHFDINEQKPKTEPFLSIDIPNSKKRPLSGDNGDMVEHNIKRSKLHDIIQQLRNEEANLLMLKRLRACQVTTTKTNGFYPHNSATTNSNTATRIPPTLTVAANKNPLPSPSPTALNQSRSTISNNTNHQSQAFRKQQPPTTSSSSVMNNKPQSSSRQQPSLLTTKPQLANNYQQQQLTTNSNNNTNHIPSYTLEQRMTAAKIALRKQLERQLLDIPSPKPMLQDVQFVPNPSSFDFQMLQGLEDVLQCLSEINIVEKENLKRLPQRFTDRAEILDPFVCSNCKTDWTTRWWKNDQEVTEGEDEDDLKNILCDRCKKQVIRRSSKTEHSALLKNVFVSAMEQERDIEKNFNTLIRHQQQQQQRTARNTNSTNNMATRNQIPSSPSNHRLPSRNQSALISNTNQRAKISPLTTPQSQFATKLSQQSQVNRKPSSFPKQPINQTSLQYVRQQQILQPSSQQQRHSHSARPVQSLKNNQRQVPQSANRQPIPPSQTSLLQRQLLLQQQQQQQQMQTMKTAARRSFPANI
ncbi:unnamed protein product [Didymodactylos carnosus]|uniref:Transcriptional repressor p66 coiled-coil MBD2-interaction domain-containing protein n=1 Tax=Didymodactylos carnosus TaxID=1234261 RepID=A0A8S2GEH7_9BILA|nr:unnamed protein product [Didymodactylos carnosus]CAF3505129.1 unnamed protein product [Didymodactylos carnosus]